MEDEILCCSECGWSGPESEAMDAPDEGQDTMYFCPECQSLVLPGS